MRATERFVFLYIILLTHVYILYCIYRSILLCSIFIIVNDGLVNSIYIMMYR